MTLSLSPIIEDIAAHHAAIEHWFSSQWTQIKPPFYTSVDIRDSGFKLSPVDTNLFPAGFNNLSDIDRANASKAAQHIIHQWVPHCKRVLIIAEQHTRNTYYLEHLAYLKSILEGGGFDVKLSTLTDTPHALITPSGNRVHLEVFNREHNHLTLENFTPDCIVLNNDLSEGLPTIFHNIHQPILPSTQLGWHQRYKSNYFECYNHICNALAQHLQWDTWLLNPYFSYCNDVDFMTSKGKEALTEKAHALFERITEKYKAYHIQQKPYIVVKADSGSYGMGVLTIEDPEELMQLSLKKRSHMSKTKGNRPIHRVLLQEGVPTRLNWQDNIAEPVIYLMGAEVVGGFYRTHATRHSKENLNTPGMALVPFTLKDNVFHPNAAKSNPWEKQLYAYSVIARLSTLAAAHEGKVSQAT
jgi:glutamate--cysteine ligase